MPVFRCFALNSKKTYLSRKKSSDKRLRSLLPFYYRLEHTRLASIYCSNLRVDIVNLFVLKCVSDYVFGSLCERQGKVRASKRTKFADKENKTWQQLDQ